MGIHIALLRGINVGGKNKVPMKALTTCFEDSGARAVATYIQSGNVLFSASAANARKIPTLVGIRLQKDLGVKVPILIRSARELKDVFANNPFQNRGIAPIEALHVAFLETRPTAARVAALDPNRSPGDRFEVIGSAIYLHCPNGIARTKLSIAYFERVLGTTATIRNWKTVTKLGEMVTAGS